MVDYFYGGLHFLKQNKKYHSLLDVHLILVKVRKHEYAKLYISWGLFSASNIFDTVGAH